MYSTPQQMRTSGGFLVVLLLGIVFILMKRGKRLCWIFVKEWDCGLFPDALVFPEQFETSVW